ncbi:MAG TPA: septal ring lytic transglycosylase RlpA family protein [Frankiaceae bacterium]|nr:septal ring lytic transglycosylase RlpA family protein [Frankiaceae bacterium]
MTSLPRGRATAADPLRATAPLAGRHRAARPGRHRADHARDPLDLPYAAQYIPTGRVRTGSRAERRAALHRRARYAAAGLLALSGALAAPTVRPDSTAGLAAHAFTRPLGVRPVAARPAATTRTTRATRLAARRPAPARAVTTRPRTRWVIRTVAGPVLHGRATWYGPGFAGRRTASGEIFRPARDMTAAHRTLPFGTRLKVCHARRCVVVRINDRGPFGNAILDLSWLAAHRLGIARAGIVPVTATVLTTRRVRVAA